MMTSCSAQNCSQPTEKTNPNEISGALVSPEVEVTAEGAFSLSHTGSVTDLVLKGYITADTVVTMLYNIEEYQSEAQHILRKLGSKSNPGFNVQL